jgi:hypothetical protein
MKIKKAESPLWPTLLVLSLFFLLFTLYHLVLVVRGAW